MIVEAAACAMDRVEWRSLARGLMSILPHLPAVTPLGCSQLLLYVPEEDLFSSEHNARESE